MQDDGRNQRSGSRHGLAFALVLGLLLGLAPGAAAHSPHDVINAVGVSPAYETDGTVFLSTVMTRHRLFARSVDGGLTWQSYGLPMIDEGVRTFAFSPDYANDDTAFAATQDGVWRSVDRGDTWQKVLADVLVFDLAISPDFAIDGRLLAATASGVQRTGDRGDAWTELTNLTEVDIRFIDVSGDGTVIYAGTQVVHRSTDNGDSWTPLASFPQRVDAVAVSPLDPTGDTLAVCFGRSGLGVALSIDGGARFTFHLDGLADPIITQVRYADDGTLLSIGQQGGCYRSDTSFAPWVVSNVGIEALSNLSSVHYRDVVPAPDFATSGRVLLAMFEGFFLSDDRGLTWRQQDVYSMRVNRALELTRTFGDDGLVFMGNYGAGLIRGRLTETPVIDPFPTHDEVPAPGQGAGGELGLDDAVSGALSGSLLGAPSGATPPAHVDPHTPLPAPEPLPAWTALGAGVLSTFSASMAVSPQYSSDRTLFYAHIQLYRSHDGGRRWQHIPKPPGATVIRSIALSPRFADDRLVVIGTADGGAWRSDDGGAGWSPLNGIPFEAVVTQLDFSPNFVDDGTLYAGSPDHGLWVSTDGGWSFVPTGPPDVENRWVEVADDGTAFLGTAGDGVWRSLDGGQSFQAVNTGLPTDAPLVIESIATAPRFTNPRVAFLVSLYHGVFRTTNGGDTWAPASDGLPRDAPRVLAVSPAYRFDRTVFLTNHAGLWRSTNGGADWSPVPTIVRADEVHQVVEHVGTWTPDVALAGNLGADALAAAGCSGHTAEETAPGMAPDLPPRGLDALSPAAPLAHADGVPLAATLPHAPRSFGRGTLWSDSAGDFTTTTFYGHSVTWFALREPGSGFAEIALDGSPPQTVDLWAPLPLYEQPVFTHDFGASGWHTITVTVTGDARPGALGAAVRSDGFAYGIDSTSAVPTLRP